MQRPPNDGLLSKGGTVVLSIDPRTRVRLDRLLAAELDLTRSKLASTVG